MKPTVPGVAHVVRSLVVVAALATLAAFPPAARAAPRPPNVVVILSDDVGYGDVGCYGATKVMTPNIDRLASQGLRLTNGYAPSATCTPSRYAMLTGQYAWRKKGTNILPGDAALIIDPAKPTLPSLLKQAGYATGAVGKWHLGLGAGNVDWNGEIKPGPLELGFDTCFILPATGDRVPCVYVQDHRVANLDPNDPIKVSYQKDLGDEPTGKAHPELLKMKLSEGHADTIVNGISRIGFMSGGKAARWSDDDMADALTRKAVDFMEKNKDRPFFLYFATHDIHVPRVPHARFKGTSGCGVRGDVIQELDWSVGEVMAALDRLKLADDTLLIFSSDNGPVVNDGYADGSVVDLNGHTPAGALRGGKYSIYEGGTRVPWVARWPAKIKPGTTSGQIVALVDLPATCAALAGVKLPDDACPDSYNALPALTGDAAGPVRDHLVEHANRLAIRKSDWKFIPAVAAGAGRAGGRANAASGDAGGQLYNLADDAGETKNVAAEHPDVVKELAALLEKVRDGGRSRP